MWKKCSTNLFAAAILAAALIPFAAWADAEPEPAPTVPEPASWLLFGAGAVGFAWAIRRRRR